MEFLKEYAWFIGVPLAFIILVFFIFRPGAKRRYEKDAEIPFQDQTKGPDEGSGEGGGKR